MPVVQIDMTPVSTEVKKEIVSQVTQALINATKTSKESVSVIIREQNLENMGHAGKTLAEL